MLAEGEKDRIEALPWNGRVDELKEARTVVRVTLANGQTAHRLFRTPDGRCVFLSPEKLCRIHQEFGARAKPLMCQMYPFGFYPMGGRLAVDCSFSCCSVSQGVGERVTQQIPFWEELVGTRDRSVQERKHRLRRGQRLSGELIWEIEEQMVAFLSDPSLDLFQRIRCCTQFVRLATSGDPSTKAAGTLRSAVARGLTRQIGKIPLGAGMDRTQRMVFYQWLFLALNPAPPNLDIATDRRALQRERQKAGELFRRRSGWPLVQSRELSRTFEEIATVSPGVFLEPHCPPLQLYLEAKIMGQRFLVAGDREIPLVEAVPALFLSYPMALWTGMALAADRGADTVAEVDVREAIRLLDQTLGQLSMEALPRKAAIAWRWVLTETDLVLAATNELLGREEVPDDAELLSIDP